MPKPENALVVHMIAEQFAWNFQYAGPDGIFGSRDAKQINSGNSLGLDANDPNGKDDIVTINELLTNFVMQHSGLQKENAGGCDQCQITWAEFRQSGLLGCAHDYQMFEKELTPLLQRAHGLERSQETRWLYERLEQLILPLYYGHHDAWRRIMRSTIAINGPYFNTQRMLKQYVSKAYFPVPHQELAPALEHVAAD